jgi:hypothetical protein
VKKLKTTLKVLNIPPNVTRYGDLTPLDEPPQLRLIKQKKKVKKQLNKQWVDSRSAKPDIMSLYPQFFHLKLNFFTLTRVKV